MTDGYSREWRGPALYAALAVILAAYYGLLALPFAIHPYQNAAVCAVVGSDVCAGVTAPPLGAFPGYYQNALLFVIMNPIWLLGGVVVLGLAYGKLNPDIGDDYEPAGKIRDDLTESGEVDDGE